MKFEAAERKALIYLINNGANIVTMLGAVVSILKKSDDKSEARLGAGLDAYVDAFIPEVAREVVRHRTTKDIMQELAEERKFEQYP